MTSPSNHSVLIGYLLWIFGFTGSHRFYYGKTVSGAIWFGTMGLFGVGWLVDLVLIPRMARQANQKFLPGPCNYDIGWLLLTFLGYLGAHRFYMRKWFTGIVYLATLGLLTLGFLYDLFTLNRQIDELNARSQAN